MKKLTGTIVSTKMPKTVVVEIQRTITHPLYKKAIARSNRIKAHTDETLQVGDTVQLIATRPISKQKHYRVEKVLKTHAK
jgi:small subunit ribosomal protein S17